MILIYTGDGKGKTSASVGQALRAYGNDLPVAFGQFMKRNEQAGEQVALATLLGERFHAHGKGFYTREEQYPEHRKAADGLLEWAHRMLLECDMVVLDETLYALRSGLITDSEVKSLIASARSNGAHLVLSGRGCPQWLEDEADLVTEMREVKHHYQQGVSAQKGIEF